MSRRRAALAAIVAGVVATGCSSTPQSPVAPSITATSSAQPAPVPGGISGVSSASLAIEDAHAIVHRDGTRFGYDVRFLLRETGGRSGATVTAIYITGPDGSDGTGAGCWKDALRVPPGGTLDTFLTDAGREWLVYCAPGAGGPMPTPVLSLEVTFTDDEGRVSSATSSVTVR